MPTDNIFDDSFMNDMLLNPDLYGFEESSTKYDETNDNKEKNNTEILKNERWQ